MGADSVEKIIESFPHSKFPKQHGESNYDKIQTIHELLATDETSTKTTRGGGRDDCLAIVMLTDAACHTLKGRTLMPPK